MTDTKPPEAPASTETGNGQDGTPDRGERLGTVLMAVAITGLVILVIDVATKGRLLAPLFSLLPAPKPATVPEAPDDTPPAPGE